MRERERLLHPLEVQSSAERQRCPKADVNRVVKCHVRCAAGQSLQKPSNLRTVPALLDTINYLLDSVITNTKFPQNVIYDFICDRLMAVRQDVVVQNLDSLACIRILQSVVTFHAYAAFCFYKEPISKFDPKLNNKHLQETLKKLLKIYSESDAAESNKRTSFESIYLLHNLGNAEAMRHALQLPKNLRERSELKLSLEISLSFVKRNYLRACRLMEKLPLLLEAVASLHFPRINEDVAIVMSKAYRNNDYPLNDLLETNNLALSERKLLRYSKYQL